jgi:uncharacterized protein YdeI (YjbR/CyaY-like superfamily)
MVSKKPTFFRSASDFRRWLERHHDSDDELWVGYYKKDSGRPSITWHESVEEAICYGWIDGIRKSVDDISYKIRFTPRRSGSVWSKINIRLARMSIKEGRMQPPGLKAFQAHRENKSGIYSYDQRRAQLEEPYNRMLKKNRAAWDYFQAKPPSYRKAICWWIISAKKEETRLRRLEKLIKYSERGQTLPEMIQKEP